MSITFSAFLQQITTNPVYVITVLLTLAVIIVNGATDAPNAIATCVSTRSMSPRKAIGMAAFFNLIGILVMTSLNQTIAETIYHMVDFGADTHNALVALCAAMSAIVIWGALTWALGIPTSQSHSLIAGLTGSAIAVHNGLGGINGGEWVKVLYGLVLSTILGFATGWLLDRITVGTCRKMDRRKTNVFFQQAQNAGGALMAFMHGAQDGQKFISVFFMGVFLASGHAAQGTGKMNIPFWIMVLCAVTMGLGTSIGGPRIIKSVGMDMVKVESHQGFSADMAAALCLLISNLTGWPVSTTHTKTTALMGVGASRRLSAVNWSVVKNMILAWVLTFPGCGLIGYIAAKFFALIF